MTEILSGAARSGGPLAGLRVLDLATPRAELAGCILADLGAEVVKIEPPEGAASRRLPPFAAAEAGESGAGEPASLFWAAYGRGKLSHVVDLDAPDGQAELRRLAAGADVLIESFDPGTLDALGLGYAALAAVNPALVYVSVTPYGQHGPKAGLPASDLTIEAAGALLGLQGDGDRPPVPVGYPQARAHAGAQAAADTVIALNERVRSGLGQHLDVSMQACMVWTLLQATGYPPNEGRDPPGSGVERTLPRPPRTAGLNTPELLACADGHVVCLMGPFSSGLVTMVETAAWMAEEGPLPPAAAAIDWPNWPEHLAAGRLTMAAVDAGAQHLVQFLAGKTKAELFARACPKKMLIAPVNNVADLLEDASFQARGYWADVGGRRQPGRFARLSRTPLEVGAPAPALDSANGAVHGPRRPAAPGTRAARSQPFAGIKVADFAWAGVGPIISKALADHGATVVHVESRRRIDLVRLLPPFKDGIADPDRAQMMANFNSSKLGLALDFANERGRGLARRLIDWADVVVENFTAGTMARLGLGWDTISRDRPDLIMLSSTLRGQTGPYATYGGYGNQGAAVAGIHGLTGWPDRAPAGPYGAYTDFIAPRFGVAALAAALYERQRSGKGQLIDLAQAETAIQFIAPLVLDYTVNGRIAGPAGHGSLEACPHGVYRAAGTERYVALAVETPAHWRGLCALAPLAQFGDPRFDAVEARRAAAADIDAALGAWCVEQAPFDLAERLCGAGVPAAVVQWPSDLYRDPQLAHRGFFVTLDHTAMGPTPYDGPATIFSATPAHLHKAAPTLGEDTDFVLEALLGLGAAEIAEHRAAGILA